MSTFDSAEVEQAYVEVMNFKVRQKKTIDNTTKAYMKSYKELQELDAKIKAIMSSNGRTMDMSDGDTLNMITASAFKASVREKPESEHETNISRLNSYNLIIPDFVA